MATKMKIAVLITCHNRKATTLKGLESLRGAIMLLDVAVGFEVFLVDDNSTDGTSDAVEAWSAKVCVASGKGIRMVHLIVGNGSLFWAKGMELAWREALKGVFDGYLWLNDDTDLYPLALSTLLLHHYTVNADSVLVGELENFRGEIVYGKRGDLFTGNFVFVPQSVYKRVGIICGDYAHAWADSDYALRCKRNGVSVVSCGVVGRCEGHPNRPSLKGLSLRQRWMMLGNPKGWSLHDLWLYRRRNWGLIVAVCSCVHLMFHVLKGER